MTVPVLADRLADRIVADAELPCRVAVDRPAWAGVELEVALAAAARGLGLEVVSVDAGDFLRPASLRFEHGRDDPDAFYDDWLDAAGLRREVLDPLGPGGSRRYLPTLWDAAADRATRAAYQVASARPVTIVSGPLLLGRGLPFELTIHLALSPAARRRRVPPDDAGRELPAYDRYDAEVAPQRIADVVVRADDPRHIAVIDRWQPGRRTP